MEYKYRRHLKKQISSIMRKHFPYDVVDFISWWGESQRLYDYHFGRPNPTAWLTVCFHKLIYIIRFLFFYYRVSAAILSQLILTHDLDNKLAFISGNVFSLTSAFSALTSDYRIMMPLCSMARYDDLMLAIRDYVRRNELFLILATGSSNHGAC